MNQSIVYVEIIDDDWLNVYQNGERKSLKDYDLLKYKNNDWVLLDPLYVSSQVFDRQVKDKKLLNKVIKSSMEKFLLHPVENYQFSSQKIDGKLWVSWIEKKRLAILEQRFSNYQNNIKSLASAPLLAGLTIDANASSAIFQNYPFTYAVLADKTLVMPNEGFNLWLDNSGLSEQFSQNVVIKDNQKLLSAVFNPSKFHYKKLPNLLTTKEKVSGRNIWVKPILLATVIFFILWAINSYLLLQKSKEFQQQIQLEQLDLIKKIFPNANVNNTRDPYGRLKAEFSKFSNKQKNIEKNTNILEKINKILLTQSVKLKSFDIDVDNKTIILQAELNDAILAEFKKVGFSLSVDNNQILLGWK